jgi:hypothetical protein
MRRTPTNQKAATSWQRNIFCAMLAFTQFAYGQPAIPKFETFQPVSLKTGSSSSFSPPFTVAVNPMLPNDPNREQNYKMMQQAGMTVPVQSNIRERSSEEVREALNEARDMPAANGESALNAFQNSLREFNQLNPDNFSITRAVYLSESAFYGQSVLPPYEEFENAIRKRAELVRQILRKESLSEIDNLSVNYAIQKLFRQDNEFYDSATGKTFLVKKISYDFDDYMGEKDWTKMYVTKLLHSGSGQCHSLPLLYLCIAEQLHAKAYLSLAPNHSFIQYFDADGNKFNFETTNANLVSETWLVQNTFVTSTAIKNKTYLDTLSNRKLFAQCLGDLLLSYFAKMPHYDNFSNELTRDLQRIYPDNITALMEQANLAYAIYRDELRKAGNPSEDMYTNFPNLQRAFTNFNLCRQRVDQTGFQRMPEEAYQKWLKSLEYEKQRQKNEEEQEKMNQEIKRLKLKHSTLKNNFQN